MTFQRNADSLSVTKSGFTYTYDRVGNRLSVLEDDGDRTTWTYDPTYQLLTEHRTGNVAFRATFTYDPVGNRLTQADLDDGLVTYTYDIANQLQTEFSSLGTTSYSYDLTGNRISKDDPVAGVTNYVFDETNRMLVADTGSAVVSQTYNAEDQLVAKETSTGTRKFVYDFKKLLLETKADDSTELVYDFALNDEYGELTSRYHDGLTNTDFYQFDGLGSTDSMSDDGGVDLDTYAYRAFGEIASPPPSESNDFTFVGRYGYFFYPELDLYFAGMQGRNGAVGGLLDPKTGQWNRPDPRRAKEDNLYDYDGNNPINVIDPSGLQPPFMQPGSYSSMTISAGPDTLANMSSHRSPGVINFDMATIAQQSQGFFVEGQRPPGELDARNLSTWQSFTEWLNFHLTTDYRSGSAPAASLSSGFLETGFNRLLHIYPVASSINSTALLITDPMGYGEQAITAPINTVLHWNDIPDYKKQDILPNIALSMVVGNALSGEPPVCEAPGVNAGVRPANYSELPIAPESQGVFELIHGNSLASPRTAYLYRLETESGEFLKWGVTQDMAKRYPKAFLVGKRMVPWASGSRADMIRLERRLVETQPGSLNFERWAGSRPGGQP